MGMSGCDVITGVTAWYRPEQECSEGKGQVNESKEKREPPEWWCLSVPSRGVFYGLIWSTAFQSVLLVSTEMTDLRYAGISLIVFAGIISSAAIWAASRKSASEG